MEERREIVKKHLEEMKAKQKSKSFDELRTRMIGERKIRSILSNLAEDGVFYDEILLKNNESNRPDFILMSGDVKIPVFYEYSLDDLTLSKEYLENLKVIFYEQNYDYIIIVLSHEDKLLAIQIDLTDIETALLKGRYIIDKSNLSDFEELVKAIFSNEIPILDTPAIKIDETVKLQNIENQIREICTAHILNSRNSKRPSLDWRSEALETISHEDIAKLCDLMVSYYSNQLDPEKLVIELQAIGEKR